MNDGVLDTCVLIAVLRRERIEEEALSLIAGGAMSTVNLAELYSKLTPDDMVSASPLQTLLSQLQIEVFTLQQARVAGELLAHTRHAGLSLGDRACLALAMELGVPAYTTDKNWLRVDVGCEIVCLR